MTGQIQDIQLEIEIAVSPERVWRAWTEPSEMLAWWEGEGFCKMTSWSGDVRPGGVWHADLVNPRGRTFTMDGTYLTVDRPHRLVFTWQTTWDEPDDVTEVELTLVATETGTRLTLVHTKFLVEESRDEHAEGWPVVLGWLQTYLGV